MRRRIRSKRVLDRNRGKRKPYCEKAEQQREEGSGWKKGRGETREDKAGTERGKVRFSNKPDNEGEIKKKKREGGALHPGVRCSESCDGRGSI